MFHQTILQLLSVSILYMCTISSARPIEQNPKSINPPYTCYECFMDTCDNPYKVTCDGGMHCFTHAKIADGYVHREKGCHKVPFIDFALCNKGISSKKRNETNFVHTCCDGHLCNDDEIKELKIPKTTVSKPTMSFPTKKIKNKVNMTKKIKNKVNMTKKIKNKVNMTKKIKNKVNMTKILENKVIVLKRHEFEKIIFPNGNNLINILFPSLMVILLPTFAFGASMFTYRRTVTDTNEPDIIPKVHRKPTANVIQRLRKYLKFSSALFGSTRKIPSYISDPDVIPKLHHKSTDNKTFTGVWTEGSGSGFPTLTQRSLSQDVTLVKCIGQGRYGEVWQAKMHGENIAVKLFSSVDAASWTNEVNIFHNIALYHENVLGFKGSAVASRLGVTEMWLVTAYHEQGSLYDYLMENKISHKEMMALVRSACSGLLHLHTEVFGSIGKPAIAHRDLKTKNILVSIYGTCVIADFGLAVTNSGESSCPENYKVGTKRYMAPELLDESMKTNTFETFKRADMYAFGLILWEICSRCIGNGTDETFRLAYHDCVRDNPGFDDITQVVCIENRRPEIPDSWSSDEALTAMAELMKHCWHKNPEVRYTVYRAKKTLDKLYEQYPQLQSIVKVLRI